MIELVHAVDPESNSNMGIVKKPTSTTKDYVAGADRTTTTNNLSSQHAMINPLSEDAAEVHQNLLNGHRQQQQNQPPQKRSSKDKAPRSAASTGRCGLGSWLAHKSGGTSEHWGHVTVVNVVFYILCVAAIGCSVYLNYRQSFVEERLRYMRHLDERLTDVESRLENVLLQSAQLQQKSRRRVSPAINGFFSTTEKEVRHLTRTAEMDSGEVEDDEDGSSTEEEEYEDMKSVVRKLSLQVEGIQRLRRDVSHLKLTRQQRQTAIEQSPEDMCTCPPGKLILIPIFKCLLQFKIVRIRVQEHVIK